MRDTTDTDANRPEVEGGSGMDALIVTAASMALALAMLLVPPVFVATAMLAAILLLIGASAAVLARLVGPLAAE